MNKNPIERALAEITVGPEVVVENLIMFPLLGRPAKRLDFVTLDDAIHENSSEITEV
jgi:hypothetical protein